MPKVLEILGYIIYFWSDEEKPLEPLHVHVAHKPTRNGTKIWILSNGNTKLEHNKSRVPEILLNRIMKTISDYHEEIEEKWKNHFQIKEVKHIDDSHKR